MQSTKFGRESLGAIWIVCPYPVITSGLIRTLESKARVYHGKEPPADYTLSFVVLYADGAEDLCESMKRIQNEVSEARILVFNTYMDLPLVRSALQMGAQGFIHAGMEPAQIIRALSVASKGEIAAPRDTLKLLAAAENRVDFVALTSRQREILALIAEGLSNAQIARRLYLSESTVKQHLRAAYKLLGVNNRNEAAKLIRDTGGLSAL